MKLIGLTGGIGSGKSTVAKLFELLNIPVFNSDIEARKIMETQSDVKEKLIQLVGEHAFFEDGKLNAVLVGKQVFGVPEKLKEINALVHPKVKVAFQHWIALQHTKYVINEAAILIESGRFRDLDALICVNAPENARIKRVMKRSNLSELEVMQRIKNQMNNEERAAYCTYNILNDDFHALIPQVLAIHTQLIAD